MRPGASASVEVRSVFTADTAASPSIPIWFTTEANAHTIEPRSKRRLSFKTAVLAAKAPSSSVKSAKTEPGPTAASWCLSPKRIRRVSGESAERSRAAR